MLPETQRPIEKLLRAYASKRREEAGAPFELGAEARRRLLREARAVQGTNGAGLAGVWNRLLRRGLGEEGTTWGVLGLRRGLAGGLAIFLVLAGLAVVLAPNLRRGHREMSLAKTSEKLQGVPKDEKDKQLALSPTTTTPAPAPISTSPAEIASEQLDRRALGSAPGVNLPKGEASSSETGNVLSEGTREVRPDELAFAPAMPPERPATPQPAPPTPSIASSFAAQTDTSREVASAAAPDLADRSALASDLSNRDVSRSYGLAGGRGGGRGSVGLLATPAAPQPPTLARHFMRVAPAPGSAGAAGSPAVSADIGQQTSAAGSLPMVLASFDFTQSGQNVRIVDADGSVYEGAVQPVRVPSRAIGGGRGGGGGAATEQARLEELTKESAAAGFRVSGTNRTSGQLVVITGNLARATDTQMLSAPQTSSKAGRAGGGLGGAAPGGVAGTRAGIEPVAGSQLAGKVTFGDGRELEFRAVGSQ